MIHSELPEVLPEELAALDELAHRLEQYQTFLIAGSGFTDAARAQAGNASGTARPALERLHPNGAAGIAQIEAVLRLRRTETDPKTILEELDPALKDLRALIAAAKLKKRTAPSSIPEPTLTTGPMPVGFRGSASASTPAAARSRAWIWVGGGLVVGLFLGAFGTALPRSADALSRVRVLLEPVIAAGSGGILGYFLLQSRDLKRTVRNHWVTLLVCSALLVGTVPTAVDSAKELFGMGAASAKPRSQESPAAAHVTPTPPVPTTGNPASPAQATDSPSPQPSPTPAASAPAPQPPPTPATSAPAPQPPPKPTAGAPAPQQGKATPKVTRSSPGALSAECRRLLERATLGEQDNFTVREKALLQECK